MGPARLPVAHVQMKSASKSAPKSIVTYDLHAVHLQLIEPLRDKAAHYRLIVGVGRSMPEIRTGLRV